MTLFHSMEKDQQHYLQRELNFFIRSRSDIFELFHSGLLDGLWYRDLEHPDNEWMSPRFWEILGYNPTDKKHLSKEWQDVIFPEDLKAASINCNLHCKDSSHPYDLMLRYKHVTGSTVWFRSRGIAIRDEKGKPIRMLGAYQDITKLKESEEELVSLKDRITLATQSAGIGIWEWDIPQNILLWDDRMYELYGIHKDQFTGAFEAWKKGLHPDDREREASKVQQALRGEIDFNTFFRVVWPSGNIRTIEAHGIVQRDTDGKPVKMLGVNWDITEKKMYEDDLQKYRLAVDSATEGIIITDPSQKICYVNPAWCALNGYTSTEVIGMTVQLLKSENTKEHVYCEMREAMKKNTSYHSDEFVNRRKDGSEYNADLTIYPVKHEYTKLVKYWVGILSDISVRKKDEMAKTEFVTLASHQLRTPLAAMRWSFEILLEKASHFTPVEKDLLEKSYTAMLSMTQTINTMLSVAHIDAKKVAVNPTIFSLRSLLQSVVEEFSAVAKKNNIALTIYVPQECQLTSDSNILREVLLNILSNSVQYTLPGGTISVSLSHNDHQVMIAVTDSGIGIPQGEMKNIFKKLHRAENAIRHKASGNGLGLYIVRSLITILGGTVSVTSTEGKGTTFTVLLPFNSSF